MAQPRSDAAAKDQYAANLERFHKALARLRAGDDDDLWLAEGLADLHARGALDVVFLLPAHGRAPTPPTRKALLRERNAALHRWAAVLRVRSIRQAADIMASVLRNYAATSAFRQHIASGQRPAGQNGFAYDVLRHQTRPIAANTIKTILLKRNGSCLSKVAVSMIQGAGEGSES